MDKGESIVPILTCRQRKCGSGGVEEEVWVAEKKAAERQPCEEDIEF